MEKSGFANSRCLVTGATGFIGHHLVRRLLDDGADVAIFVLDEERPIDIPVTIYRGNIQNLSDIQRAIVRFQPEYIFHLAAQPLVDTALRGVLDTLNTNIQGSINLLHACIDAVKLRAVCYITTDKVYDFTDRSIANEFDPLGGFDHPYNASKVCADILAQMYSEVFGVPVAIVRTGNVYGEGDLNWDRIIPYACKQVSSDEQIVLRSNGLFERDYLYVDDVIDGYFAATKYVEKIVGACFIVNFGASESETVLDIVNTVFSVSGRKVNIEIENKARHEIPYQHLDWSRAYAMLDWQPKTSLEEGLKRTYEWYKEYLRSKQ